MPVPVPRRKIHQRICAGRVLPQHRFHMAQVFDKIPPVGCTDHPQRADAVADGYLVTRLFLIFLPDQVVAGHPHSRQLLFHPAQWQRQRWPLTLQLAGETGHKSAVQYRLRPRHIGDRQDQVARFILDGCRHPVRPIIGQVSIDQVQRDLPGDPAQVFNHSQTQHDGDSP